MTVEDEDWKSQLNQPFLEVLLNLVHSIGALKTTDTIEVNETMLTRAKLKKKKYA